MKINKAFVRDKGKCLTPVYVQGESYSFFINADKPFTDPNWALLDLHILTGDGQLMADSFATLTRLFPYGGASPAYYLQCVFPMPPLPNGEYKFGLFQYGSDAYRLYSNPILVENDITDRTAFVDYRNSFNKYGVLYESNSNFRNRFRLPIVQIDLQFESDRKQYRNVTDRKLRNITSYRDAVLTLQAIKFDDDGFEALSAMYEHDDIIIDGYQVEPKSGLTIDNTAIAELRNGKAEVYISNADNQYGFYNINGGTIIYSGTANYQPSIIYQP